MAGKENIFEMIYTTTDYDRFKFFGTNREIDEKHQQRIEEAMKKQTLFSPIIVNENYEIIDGQHRFVSYKNLKKPVPYIIKKGYTEEETFNYNINSKNWTINDYLNMYVQRGNEHYKRYFSIRQIYSVDHQVMLRILNMSSSFRWNEFKEGKMIFTEEMLPRIIETLDKVSDFKDIYERWKSRSFVFALLRIFQHPDYDHKKMVEKAYLHSGKLRPSPTVKEYLRQLEEIYNYSVTEKNRIRFF